MATFHPAYVLRQTGGEPEGVKRMVWADLKAVRDRLGEPVLAAHEEAPEQVGLFAEGA